MAASLFFYDLETTGLYADSARIVQFAGQRTNFELQPIGEPINLLIKQSADILPDPTAVLVHAITPQQTLSDGLSEAEFLHYFNQEIALTGTTFVGFNNIRFDDDFLRYLNYRNLYDPYAWSYESGRGRWDILDVVRITRALRPNGIRWPIDSHGAAVNKLELLTKENTLDHFKAHDALSDVQATIAVAQLIKSHQPRLYDYLFQLRDKKEASTLINSGHPFIYTSSHYPKSILHTTIVTKVADHPQKNCALVYDLRHDPGPWLSMSEEQLANAWRYDPNRPKNQPVLPIKTVRLNRCPAIAPMSVLDSETEERLQLDMEAINQHRQTLATNNGKFSLTLSGALKILDEEQAERHKSKTLPVDARMYDGFYNDHDKQLMNRLHKEETADNIRELRKQFQDKRLAQLAGLYLARNYPSNLTGDERAGWDRYLTRRLLDGDNNSRLAVYFQQIEQLATERHDKRSQLILEDLRLYGESLIPSDI